VLITLLETLINCSHEEQLEQHNSRRASKSVG
jgi:hypothetical protein